VFVVLQKNKRDIPITNPLVKLGLTCHELDKVQESGKSGIKPRIDLCL
jgi:hypothetical protein